MAKIGVLGGIGPEASAEYYMRLIRGMQKKEMIDSNRNYPQIIINSIPAPEPKGERITAEELSHYTKGLIELDGLGVDFIVMVCNTIHLYYKKLSENISAPIIDLRKEIQIELSRRRNVFVIGTSVTLKQELYHGSNVIYPSEKDVQLLEEAFKGYNAGKKEHVQTVREICEKHIALDAESVLLGCTEFALMLKNAPFPTIDTIDLLVSATITKILNTKKRRGINHGKDN